MSAFSKSKSVRRDSAKMGRNHQSRNRTAMVIAAGSVVALIVSPAHVQATTYYFDVNGSTAGSGVTDGGNYNWLVDPNWSTDSSGNSSTSAQPFSYTGHSGDGDSAVFVAGADAGTSTYTVNVTGQMGVHNIEVNSGNLTINTQNNNFILNADSGTYSATWTVDTGASLNVVGSAFGYLGAVNMDNNSLVITGGGNMSIAGLWNSGGGLTMNGTGTLTMTAASNYSGPTNVSAGTLQIGVQNGISSSSPITVGSGATLSMTAASNNTLDINNVLTLNGGTLSAPGGSPAGYYGNFHLDNSGSITVGANTGTSYITGSVSLDGHDIYNDYGGFSPITVGDNSTLDISGGAFGVNGVSWGGISKYGNGTLELTGYGGYGSGMYIEAGTVEFASGSLSPVNAADLHASSTYAADFEGNATLQWAPGNTQDVSGNQGNGGANATGIKIADGVTATFDTNGNDVTLGTAFATGGAGTGAVVKAGLGTLTLAASNSYSGGTTVNGGTLALGVQNALNSSGAITVNLGATFETNAASNNTQDINNVLTLNGGNLSAGTGATAPNYGNFHLDNNGSIAVGANTGTSTITGSLSVDGRDIVNDNSGYSAINVGGNSTLNIAAGVFGVGGLSWGGISKYGPGTLELTGGASLNVGVVLEAGTLEFASGSFPAANPGFGGRLVYGADFEGNGTLQWAPGNTQDVSGISSIAQIKIADGITATFDTNNNNVTLGTAFATGGGATGAVVKAGQGTLTLTAANTFSGGTTISAGTLAAVGTALGTGPVTVSGGTIAVNDGVTTTAQTLTTADQTWKAGGGYTARIFNDGSSDQMQITAGSSSLTIDGSVSTLTPFTVTAGTTTLGSIDPAVRQDWVIASGITTLNGVTAPTTGDPTVLAIAGAGASSEGFVLNVPSNLFSGPEAGAPLLELEASGGGQYSVDVVYTAAPEPGTAMLLLAGAGPMLMGRRRRKH